MLISFTIAVISEQNIRPDGANSLYGELKKALGLPSVFHSVGQNLEEVELLGRERGTGHKFRERFLDGVAVQTDRERTKSPRPSLAARFKSSSVPKPLSKRIRSSSARSKAVNCLFRRRRWMVACCWYWAK